MNFRIQRCWPWIAGLFVYWATVATLVWIANGMNAGHFVYPLDDPYIHMSIAKNAATRGVWGVTPYEFTSSTSSPLWTFLLAAAFFLFGVHETVPLILNLLGGTLLISTVYLILTRYIQRPVRVFLTLLVLIFATPLPTLTFSGMEHVFHALFFTIFLFLAIPLLSAEGRPTLRQAGPIFGVAVLMVLTRYEGLFLAFVVCAFLTFQRKITLALTLGAAALFPPILYGCWAVSRGWYFLPTSVILKGNRPQLSLHGILNQIGLAASHLTLAAPHILVLLVFSALILLGHFLLKKRRQTDIQWAHRVFLGAVLLHMLFAAVGLLFRYEAYLVFIGLGLVAISVNELLPQSWISVWKEKGPLMASALVLLALVVATPFYNRASEAIRITPQASNNIYEQQYQMANFLKRHYPTSTVAANDIGAITYFTDIHLVDLMGLGTMEMARLKLNHSETREGITALMQERGVSLALVYDSWFQDGGGTNSLLPPNWTKAADWKIPHNIVCGGSIVSIYAAKAQDLEPLKTNLRQFAPELPPQVEQAAAPSRDPGDRGEFRETRGKHRPHSA